MAVISKKCTKCGECKSIEDFVTCNRNKSGKASKCKSCQNALYIKKGPRPINIELQKEGQKRYRQKNIQKIRHTNALYREKNAELIREKDMVYRQKNRDRIKLWHSANKLKRSRRESQRKAADPLYKLSCNLRSRLSTVFRRMRCDKNTTTRKILGADFETVKSHIELQFKPGMSWENYGEWHIDHIVPLAKGKTQGDLIRLSHYSNLQPLWAIENLIKGSKILHHVSIS